LEKRQSQQSQFGSSPHHIGKMLFTEFLPFGRQLVLKDQDQILKPFIPNHLPPAYLQYQDCIGRSKEAMLLRMVKPNHTRQHAKITEKIQSRMHT
jgi:hypothetical protein